MSGNPILHSYCFRCPFFRRWFTYYVSLAPLLLPASPMTDRARARTRRSQTSWASCRAKPIRGARATSPAGRSRPCLYVATEMPPGYRVRECQGPRRPRRRPPHSHCFPIEGARLEGAAVRAAAHVSRCLTISQYFNERASFLLADQMLTL